jgi:hypothetical protein
MSSVVGDVVIKLAVEYLLPYVVQEAAGYATRSAVTYPVQHVSLRTPKPNITRQVRSIPPTSVPSVLSFTPGRIRIHIADLRGDPARGAVLAASLTSLRGVQAVRANDLTGNVLVHYDPNRIHGKEILNAVAAAKPIDREPRQMPGSNRREVNSPKYLMLVRS